MNPERKAKIMRMFTNCPLVTTDQIARYFDNAQPNKRASWALCQLEEEKLIEGYNRGLAGLTKLWRLTVKGRKAAGVSRPAVPFTDRNVNHWLGLADCWQALTDAGELFRWKMELREPFGDEGKKYCGDAFFALRHNGKTTIAFLEYQRSDMTTTQWGNKWAMLSAFHDSKAWSKASFQDFKNNAGEISVRKPDQVKIIVVSKHQQPDTIQGSSKLPIIIVREAKEIPLHI